jgi:Phosphatidylserine/phosphatidylglycerophosphate/cardiolipin synthases and related enzymes
MTEEKTNKTKKTNLIPDLELIAHKYSDFYPGFIRYDVREIDYPVYKAKVKYSVTKAREVHPVIVSVLKIIQFLETVNNGDSYSYLREITQLDEEILDSILAEITTKGYLKQDELKLSKNGKEILEKEKELVTENASCYLNFDGIFGTVMSDSGRLDQNDKKRTNAIEFKPYVKSRPRIEYLDDDFSENKTLRQVIIENLQNKDFDITDILQIDTNKYFKRYICLFFKDAEDNEKFLALNQDHEIDSEATDIFDRLATEQKFDYDNVSHKSQELLEENVNKFNSTTPETIIERTKPLESPAITDGKTIEVDEHKRYFIYILENAKRSICIQSPWINWRTLQIYKEYIENAVKRGVRVTVKYGMKPRNRFDKIGIDKESQAFFDSLNKNNFHLIKTDDHSKIVICDDDFMIMGSFNWLSFGGGDEKDARGETSTINMNKAEIKKQTEKFN